jgi:DNA-binding response OmpR family regulator
MSDNQKTALIIEDDYSIFCVLELMLQDSDIRSVQAECLSSARKLIDKIIPDYIFVDHFLPDGPGIDFIPFLRKRFSNSLIITMTAQNTHQNKIESARNGSDYFLEKPFSLSDVYRSINSRLARTLNPSDNLR